jgi:hypothetical protein
MRKFPLPYRTGPRAAVPPIFSGLFFALGIFAVASLAEAAPRIGFVYPAGGQAGTTFEVEVGGQGLKDPIGMVFTGDGISVEVIDHNRLPSAQVISDYRDKLRTLRGDFKSLPQGLEVPSASVIPEIEELLATVELTPKQVWQIDEYSWRRNDPKRQLNNQIGESVWVRVTIEPEVAPGFRHCRLQTATGLSNPMPFIVGDIPEYREPKVRKFHLPTYLGIETAPEIEADESVLEGSFTLPATVNGQIYPGEVDEFVFEAKKDDKVVISVEARSLVPYLADAVPGWFQAVVSIRDPRGRELAFSDDYKFNPDPVLFYKIPRDGKYRLHIHDSIYRGREDFVYRITLGELPFLTSVSPLGGQAGEEVDLVLQGGNLAEFERKRYELPEEPGMHPIRATGGNGQSNPIFFHVDNVPEDAEREDNNRLGAASEIPIPSIVNGVISENGDVDFYRIRGKGRQPMTFEIFARRLGSPLDANLTIYDDDGKQIAWNDAYENPSAGLTTHHADPRITINLPSNGDCFIRVGETQNIGSPAHAYRFKVTQGTPDVALRATPSSLNAKPGGSARVTVHALRLGAFDGPIRIELEDAPEGYSMRPATIDAGKDTVTVGISVPSYPTDEPDEIKLRGVAIEDGKDTAILQVVPAEDMTQAFITKHIVPVDALLVDIRVPPVPPKPQ